MVRHSLASGPYSCPFVVSICSILKEKMSPQLRWPEHRMCKWKTQDELSKRKRGCSDQPKLEADHIYAGG